MNHSIYSNLIFCFLFWAIPFYCKQVWIDRKCVRLANFILGVDRKFVGKCS